MNRIRWALFCLLALLMLWPAVSPAVALALGIAFGMLLGNPAPDRVRGLSGALLKWCVVGLGFGLPLDQVLATGAQGLWLMGLSVAVILALGLLLARAFGLDRDCGRLIASGTAICGGSAIAAVAPAIGARSEAVSMAMACVFVLNAVALYLFPAVGHLLALTQQEFAMWAAIAIHDTSSVVGAAAIYGDQALAQATVLKLARALWIVPLVVGFLLVARHESGRSGRITWPLFVLLFVLAAAVRGAMPAQAPVFDQLAWLARRGLVLVLFMIGSGLTPALLKRLGWRPMAFALLLWLIVAVAGLFVALGFE